MKKNDIQQLMKKVTAAYERAVAKHPKFHDGLAINASIGKVKSESKIYKEICDSKAVSGNLTFYDLIREELCEYMAEELQGHYADARRELLDCFAVLVREWERILNKRDKK